MTRTGMFTFPQILIGNESIGGFNNCSLPTAPDGSAS